VTIEFEVVYGPEKEQLAVIYNGLVEFNEHHFSNAGATKIACFAKNQLGTIVGGLTGKILYSQLYIEILWVKEDFRGQGVGHKLLSAVEQEAKVRGLESIFVDTFSFQAPTFYEKYNYLKVGELKDYPRTGIDKIFYKKVIYHKA
jgi:ribosomal protein S18 acetylase RimI-like enzyme